jgi:hypothetical protein
MGNIVLGSYTFAQHPSDINEMMKAVKECAHVKTYSSVAFFSWGTSLVGKIIEMTWEYMSCDQYDSIDTLYQADAQIVFDPQDGSSKTYNVEIVEFNGKYHLGLTHDDNDYRKNIKLQILIMSEV